MSNLILFIPAMLISVLGGMVLFFSGEQLRRSGSVAFLFLSGLFIIVCSHLLTWYICYDVLGA